MSPHQTATGADAGAPAGSTASDGAPRVVVARGVATAEEVAAVVAVLAAASADGDGSAPDAARSAWAAHGATLRRPVGHGPGAWRASLRS